MPTQQQQVWTMWIDTQLQPMVHTYMYVLINGCHGYTHTHTCEAWIYGVYMCGSTRPAGLRTNSTCCLLFVLIDSEHVGTDRMLLSYPGTISNSIIFVDRSSLHGPKLVCLAKSGPLAAMDAHLSHSQIAPMSSVCGQLVTGPRAGGWVVDNMA